jgi:enoyl-CoA hydratase/carnithine racemase
MQTLQVDYFATYHNLNLSRDAKGVLVAEFHSDGGPFIMNAQSHTEFVDAFHRIGQDRANKIVIMTGAGGNLLVTWIGRHLEMSPIRASGAEFTTKASRLWRTLRTSEFR